MDFSMSDGTFSAPRKLLPQMASSGYVKSRSSVNQHSRLFSYSNGVGIADIVGFTHHSTFVKLFSRHGGMPKVSQAFEEE